MDDASAPAEARRSSIEKVPIILETETPPPFDGLPDEIIEQILLATDPNGFASLMTLNRKWRDVAQRPHLYRYHLSRCPSYAASQGSLPSADVDNLPRLRRLFAREIKRNLFDSYVRPNVTVIKLVSKAISSSSCPGGEGMGFTTSPNGHHVLAYNSSRMYLINAQGSGIEMKREFKMLRRPVSACVSNDATLLAVLSTEMQVDIYDLKQSPPKRKQSMILDNNPRTIALSPCGTVLTAAYDGGIEVQSLTRGASPTDRRAVKCDAVDALAFSFDGTQILGTTLHSSPPSTVVITAPYYDPGALAMDESEENLSAMWTTSILFPNSSRDCSHAVLLQDGSQEEAAWAFAYDRSFETFRAVRIDDLRNGTTYFTGPVPKTTSQAKLLPCTLPSATYHGELVSACFHGNEVWVYGVPEDLTAVPEATSAANDTSGLARRNSAQSHSSRSPSTRTQEVVAPTAATGRVPQWQILCDKLRNNFVAGHKSSELIGVSNVKWVSGFGDTSLKERLIVTATGVAGPRLVTEDEDMDFVDGGRIALVDFGYALTDGTETEIAIEVGTDDAEVLEEEQRDIETEVAIVRRRTVVQRGGARGGGRRSSLMRTATIAVTPTSATSATHSLVSPISPVSSRGTDDDDPLVPRTLGRNPVSRPTIREPVDDEEFLSIEEQEALDAPYAHSSPRSGTTLRRAATVAAANRRLNPRTADGRPIEYRRADGRREHPHESDADNWEPPPPPYQAEDPGDTPAFLRGRAILAPVSIPGVIQPYSPMPAQVNPTMALQPPTLVIPSNLSSTTTHHNDHGGLNHGRSASDSTVVGRLRVDDEMHLPLSSTSGPLDNEDIYDVSPPASPPTRIQSRDSQSMATMATSQNSVTPQPTATTSRTSMGVYESSPATLGPMMHPEFDFGGPGLGFETSSISTMETSSASSNIGRRLSNAQTWPLSSPSERNDTPTSSTAETSHSALPPAPSSDQMARLIRRASQGNPLNLAGSLLSTQNQHLQRPQPIAGSLPSARNMPNFEIDQPLIISTPRGVGGAFDPPGRRTSRRGDTPIIAPVPRRPRATGGSAAPPTVERLETISTGAAQPTQPNNLVLPTWMRQPPTSPGRQPSTVNRRPSRAERSAAKNMRDAKKRGWTAKKKKKESTKPVIAEEEHNGSIWMDMDAPPAAAKDHDKDKKCSVM
ncbi:hypothetical protein TARUN_6133 [Trichoderma arundinaceum]|uniref:F-box domain-containing protein n=1 Tax=Trichoderma arundinaceum TaxID=490622 RepID=A0A395NJL6_TRIAR|nr:hypothetical protein TARUN_6133 [Trichoderma arundinaceum]